jgi:hypothetical protein
MAAAQHYRVFSQTFIGENEAEEVPVTGYMPHANAKRWIQEKADAGEPVDSYFLCCMSADDAQKRYGSGRLPRKVRLR